MVVVSFADSSGVLSDDLSGEAASAKTEALPRPPKPPGEGGAKSDSTNTAANALESQTLAEAIAESSVFAKATPDMDDYAGAAVAEPGQLGPGWQVTAGPVLRRGMKVSVEGSSEVQSRGIHAAENYSREAPHLKNPGANQTYDDGYVRDDPATSMDGTTWNWGYDNGRQYDGDTLTFHRNGGRNEWQTVTPLQSDSFITDKDIDGQGAQVSVACSLADKGPITVSLQGTLQGVNNDSAHFSGSTYQERVDSRSENYVNEYVYNTAGAVIPDAPHSGTSAGPGPQIAGTPTSVRQRTVRSSSSTWTAANQVNMDVDSTHYSATMAARIDWSMTRKLYLRLQPRLSLNYLGLNVDRTESFTATYAGGATETLGSWAESDSDNFLRLGYGIGAGVDFDVYDGWMLGVFGGYDWIKDEPKIEVGPNTVELKTSGYTAGIEVGKRFLDFIKLPSFEKKER